MDAAKYRTTSITKNYLPQNVISATLRNVNTICSTSAQFGGGNLITTHPKNPLDISLAKHHVYNLS